MAVNKSQQTVYRCNHNNIFESAAEAAACNLTHGVMDAATGKHSLPCKPFSKGENMMLLPHEIAIVTHWVQHNSGVLEHLIQQYLDDCAVGGTMPDAPATEETKKEGET